MSGGAGFTGPGKTKHAQLSGKAGQLIDAFAVDIHLQELAVGDVTALSLGQAEYAVVAFEIAGVNRENLKQVRGCRGQFVGEPGAAAHGGLVVDEPGFHAFSFASGLGKTLQQRFGILVEDVFRV